MKKRVLALILAVIVAGVGTAKTGMVTLAQENDSNCINLAEASTSVGYTNLQTRGTYLISGDSAISKINSYTVGVAGNTNAAIRCKVSVSVILERYNMEQDSWLFVNSWTQTNQNALTAGISKSVVVDSGYYYRVRSLHYAGSDASSSCTNALYVY